MFSNGKHKRPFRDLMLSYFSRRFIKTQPTTPKKKMSIEGYAVNCKKVSKYPKLFLFQNLINLLVKQTKVRFI